MSRKTNTLKALVVVGAVAGAAFGVAPAQAATPVVTKAGPLKAATTTESVITVSGTGFSDAIKTVRFTSGATSCDSTAVVVTSASVLYAKKPASGCAVGKQTVTLFDGATTAVQLGAAFNPTDATKTTTFVDPQIVTAFAPLQSAAVGSSAPSAGGLHLGGTPVKVTTSTTLPTTGISAKLGGKPLSAIKYIDANNFTAKVPAGTPGDASLVVTANGVPSAPFVGWNYKRAIKLAPQVWVKGAPAPVVKIDTVGLPLPTGTAATVAVTFGAAAATERTTAPGKPRTATTMYVDAPAFPTTAGPVNVTVTVDPDGAGALPAVASVVTGTSGFVYADY